VASLVKTKIPGACGSRARHYETRLDVVGVVELLEHIGLVAHRRDDVLGLLDGALHANGGCAGQGFGISGIGCVGNSDGGRLCRSRVWDFRHWMCRGIRTGGGCAGQGFGISGIGFVGEFGWGMACMNGGGEVWQGKLF